MEGLTRESLKPLLELQRIDSAIDRLTARRANLPEQQKLDEDTTARDEVATQHLEIQTLVDEAKREQTRLEHEIALIQEKYDHEETRAQTVSNARELGNIQAELDSLKRRKAHSEDDELEVMERLEGIEKQFAEVDAALKAADEQVAASTGARDAATRDIDTELASLRAERQALVPTIDPSLVEVYDEVRVKKGGVAVGALEQGVCKACGLPLSPSEKNRLKGSGKVIERCENCSRILVFV